MLCDRAWSAFPFLTDSSIVLCIVKCDWYKYDGTSVHVSKGGEFVGIGSV